MTPVQPDHLGGTKAEHHARRKHHVVGFRERQVHPSDVAELLDEGRIMFADAELLLDGLPDHSHRVDLTAVSRVLPEVAHERAQYADAVTHRRAGHPGGKLGVHERADRVGGDLDRPQGPEGWAYMGVPT